MHRRRIALLATALLATTASVACYDSTWGQTKKSQANNAAYAMPAKLEPSADGEHAPAMHPFRVRVYASPAYAAENVDHQHEIRALVEAADHVLVPTTGARLVIDRIDSWDAGTEEDLERALDALHAKDPATDVDWVVGFVGATAKASDSFRDVGRADNPGKYFVVRAASRLADQLGADRAFDKLSQDERSRVVAARKEHRALSVFLHELGHSLGAVHEIDASSVMRPAYDKDMAGFTPESLALIRPSLARRSEPVTNETDEALATELIAVLEGPMAKAWVPADRDTMLAHLRARAPKATAASPSAVVAPPVTAAGVVVDVPEISERDRPTYARAVTLAQADDVEGAWTAASPLFKPYESVYAVQDLRCQLATKRAAWPVAEPECRALMKLTRGPAPPKKR